MCFDAHEVVSTALYIRYLYLRNFRNYDEAKLEFSPGINLFLGKNAQGKTSLLEALYYLITLRSFRTQQVSDLIQNGKSDFIIEAAFEKEGVERKLRISSDGKKKRVFIDSKPCSSAIEIMGLLQGIILSPEDQQIIKGSPSQRRRFIDIHASQMDRNYLIELSRYLKAMKQRNQLLKDKREASLSLWEEQMARAASKIISSRSHLLSEISKHCQDFIAKFSQEKESLELKLKTYSCELSQKESIYQKALESFHKLRKNELLLGSSLSGPHRDDISFFLGGKDMRFFASEGQARSAVIALRLAQWKQIEKAKKEQPLMAIDDLSLSLDADRRKLLMQELGGFQQVFISSTEAFPALASKTFQIQEGKVY